MKLLYQIWGIALKDRCVPTGDNPEGSIRNDQFLTKVAKQERLNESALFHLVKKKGRKKGDNDLQICESLL